MILTDVKFSEIPNSPGVYRFLSEKNDILYIGKATNLRQRIRSYFDDDLIKTRGRLLVDMIASAKRVSFETTNNVLDALIREASLIKKYQPQYNTREKDNKSFSFIVVTKEDFPRILLLRERSIAQMGEEDSKYLTSFGPFQSAHLAKEILSIIRKIFPFRDKCNVGQSKPCFYKELGLCPGVCDGTINRKEYNKIISGFMMFMKGEDEKLIKKYTKLMNESARSLHFEDANKYKKIIFALTHINDISLISDETKNLSHKSSSFSEKQVRIEAYDISHLFGTYTVGVMVVLTGGRPDKSQYRKFKIKSSEIFGNDLESLREVLLRRFNHPEWQKPDLIVIDGGATHLKFAKKVLLGIGIDSPVVSVVKDNRHKARDVIGKLDIVNSYKPSALLANSESHRFAVEYHRLLRGRILK